jgi:hypothetical protein
MIVVFYRLTCFLSFTILTCNDLRDTNATDFPRSSREDREVTQSFLRSESNPSKEFKTPSTRQRSCRIQGGQ